MKRILSLGLAICFGASLHASEVAQPLYQLNGKIHTTKELSPALQQASFDIQRQAYDNLTKVIDGQILEEHARAEAKRKI